MLFVDGEPVITAWTERSSTSTPVGTVNLSAGDHRVQPEYFKNQGSGVAQLSYQRR